MLLANLWLSATLLLSCTQPQAARCLATAREAKNDQPSAAISSPAPADVPRHTPDALQKDERDSAAPWKTGTAVATAGAAALLYLYVQALRSQARAERKLVSWQSKHAGRQLSLLADVQQEIASAEMRATAMEQRARRYHRELHRYRAATARTVSLAVEPPLGRELPPDIRDVMLRCMAQLFEKRHLKGNWNIELNYRRAVPVPHDKWNRFVKECRDRYDLPTVVRDSLIADESVPIRVKKIVVPYALAVNNDNDDGSAASARLSFADSSRQALATHVAQVARLKRPLGALGLGSEPSPATNSRYVMGSLRLRPR